MTSQSPPTTFLPEPSPLINESFMDTSEESTLLDTSMNVTSKQQPVRDEDLAKAEVGVLILLFTLASIGNLIVILGIYFRHQKISRMYLFILHLSIADLITAVFNVATQLFMEITWPHFHGGDALCKFVKYTQILGPYSSSYVLVMTAFDRYQAICFPLLSYKWTTERSKIMLAVGWSIAFLFCIPQLFIFSIKETYDGVYDCYAEFTGSWGVKTYVTWYSISFFIVPLLLLTFAYTCICRTLWLNSNSQALGKVEFHANSRNNAQKRPSQSSTSSDEIMGNQNRLSSTRKNNHMVFGRSETKELLPLQKKKIECFTSVEPNGTILTHVTAPTPVSPSLNSLSKNEESLPVATTNLETNRGEDSGHLYNEHKWNPSGNLNGHQLINKLQVAQGERANGIGGFASPNEKVAHPGGGPSPLRTADITIKDRSPTTKTGPGPPNTLTGISRAKIKTVKLTITVILCYIICSSPFIAAQLWVAYDPFAYQSPFYTGATFTILTLLASLNSCVNPYIFLLFNPNLLEDFFNGMRGTNSRELRREKSKVSAATMRTVVCGGGAGSRSRQSSPRADSQVTPKHNFG